jgi:hypothetical protein
MLGRIPSMKSKRNEAGKYDVRTSARKHEAVKARSVEDTNGMMNGTIVTVTLPLKPKGM